MRITLERFRELVAEALDEFPAEFGQYLDNVEVVVEELPSPEIQRQFQRSPRDLLLGLYHGVPLTDRSVLGMQMPDLIYLYKRNIEAVCRSEAEIRRQIRATILHEIGHHFGMDEDQLRGI
ncbi:MAG: metallopeptidase family protein [Acidobacteria bacterium]|nr:MAG: metallopeptidase family protein [Acidobacteriota bacterium]